METMHAAGRRNLPPVPRPHGDPDRDQPIARPMHLRRRDDPAPDAMSDDFDTATIDPVEMDLGDEADDIPEAVELPEAADADDSPEADPVTDQAPQSPSAEDTPEADPATDPATDPAPQSPSAEDTPEADTATDPATDPATDEAPQVPPADDSDDVDDADDAEDASDAPADPPAAPATELEHRMAVIEPEDPAQHFVSRLRAAAADFAAAAGAESAVVREAVPPARHRRSRCRLVLRYTGGEETDLTFLGSVGRPGTPAWLGFDQQIQQWLGNGQHREAAWLVEDLEAPDGVAVDVPAWLAAG